MKTDTTISILIPCYNEAKYISGVLEDIKKQTYPGHFVEILVLDGRSEDKTREIVSARAATNENIKLIDNPGRSAPKALNIGIGKSNGEIVVRMDAHCRYPKNYIERLIEVLHSSGADNVGGTWSILPGSHTKMAHTLAYAMAHPFAIGNAQYRTGVEGVVFTDTVPFGCYRREVFDKIGLFDEELVRNQDDEFNARLIQSGGKIALIGDLLIDYYARSTYKQALRMFYQYGLFKPLVNKKLKKPATLRQFAPPIFVLAWAFALAWILVSARYRMVPLVAMALAYFVPAIYFSVKAARNSHLNFLMVYLPAVFFGIHLSYGFGYLQGILRFRLLGVKGTSVQSNR
jgi:glycosyltransferase involved in cell wall biosynthesis